MMNPPFDRSAENATRYWHNQHPISADHSDRQRQVAVMEDPQEISRELSSDDLSRLLQQGFSLGLVKALAENAQNFHHRIWVVDNSGSMQIGDGHRIHKDTTTGRLSVIPVTRWEELKDTILYHSEMATTLQSYTRFRLLNHSSVGTGVVQEFAVAAVPGAAAADIRTATKLMNRVRPDGVTPLTSHILAMQQEIRRMAPQLQQMGRRVAVILATDGLPTDDQGYGGDEITQEFVNALRSLEGLPIWLVIRLCTDEDQVTDFYNQLDGMLELSLEVLDDFIGECKEVRGCNPWLNYAIPLHRCRELGYHDRLFDLIDERPLTKGELRDFCSLLFGTEVQSIPDPVTNWSEFLVYVQERLSHEQPQWNPLKEKMKPWMSLKKLNKIYGDGSGCSVM